MIKKAKIFAMLLFPLWLVLVLIGWALYYVGSNRVTIKTRNQKGEKRRREIQFGVLPKEEQRMPNLTS
jgi:hypothetical protein